MGGSGNLTVNELYNGTAFTEAADLNTGRGPMQSFGIQTSSLVASNSNSSANTETWDGSSWTEIANINTARQEGGGAGESNAGGIIFGGYTTAFSAVAENELLFISECIIFF